MENDMSRGKFIVFEGVDGAGKTTQLVRLAEALRKEGRRVVPTAEPTESVTGGMLRDALSGLRARTPEELAALFTLDRIFHNVNPNGIGALLEAGNDVISDRYYYSSLAYQGGDTDFEWVKHMNLDCPAIRIPDLCIFLDLEPDECLKRIQKNRSSVEIFEKKEYLEKCRLRFRSVFAGLEGRDTVIIIDTTGKTVDEVAAEVLKAAHTVIC